MMRLDVRPRSDPWEVAWGGEHTGARCGGHRERGGASEAWRVVPSD